MALLKHSNGEVALPARLARREGSIRPPGQSQVSLGFTNRSPSSGPDLGRP